MPIGGKPRRHDALIHFNLIAINSLTLNDNSPPPPYRQMIAIERIKFGLAQQLITSNDYFRGIRRPD